MSTPKWVCLDCKKEFMPSITVEEIDFNCPHCGSPRTAANRIRVIVSDTDDNEDEID